MYTERRADAADRELFDSCEAFFDLNRKFFSVLSTYGVAYTDYDRLTLVGTYRDVASEFRQPAPATEQEAP